MEMTLMGQPLIQVMNEDEAWANLGGVAGDLSDEQKEAMRTGGYSTPLRLLLAVSDAKADVRYVGREQLGAQPVEAVEWVRDGGKPTRVYFAADTGLLAGLEQLELSPAGAGWVPVQRVFEDYRAVGKLRLPYHVTVYSAGAKMVESTFASVELNVGLSSDLFRRPQ
jgi:hypothetical protein